MNPSVCLCDKFKLVVEDDRNILSMIQTVLETNGSVKKLQVNMANIRKKLGVGYRMPDTQE